MALRTCFERSGGDEGCVRDAQDHGYCHGCRSYLCCMPYCSESVSAPAIRCEFCHPLGCPCETCRDWESDGVPVPIEADDTSAQTVREMARLSNDELIGLAQVMRGAAA